VYSEYGISFEELLKISGYTSAGHVKGLLVRSGIQNKHVQPSINNAAVP